ncbi:MAG: hypothetical protein ABIL06_16150, partial [Pseudomonadota bacterium]
EKMARKHVILEVVDGGMDYQDGTQKFLPADAKQGENLRLYFDRILEGAWRLGKPDKGDNILVVSDDRSLALYEIQSEDLVGHYIILDPPAKEAPPVPEWERKMREACQTTLAPDKLDLFIEAMRDARMWWGKEKEAK